MNNAVLPDYSNKVTGAPFQHLMDHKYMQSDAEIIATLGLLNVQPEQNVLYQHFTWTHDIIATV